MQALSIRDSEVKLLKYLLFFLDEAFFGKDSQTAVDIGLDGHNGWFIDLGSKVQADTSN